CDAVAAISVRAKALPASAARGRPQRLSRSPAAPAADVSPYVANPWTKSRMPESGTSGSVGAPGAARGNPTGAKRRDLVRIGADVGPRTRRALGRKLLGNRFDRRALVRHDPVRHEELLGRRFVRQIDHSVRNGWRIRFG